MSVLCWMIARNVVESVVLMEAMLRMLKRMYNFKKLAASPDGTRRC